MALLAGCTTGAPASPEEPPAPDVRMEQVTMRQYRGATLEVSVTAPRFELMRDTGDFTMREATVRLLPQGVTVTAPVLDGNLGAQTLEGRGGLVLEGADGVTGRAERARYERQAGPDGVASSDAGVHLEAGPLTLDASGFRADFATGRAVFDEPVTTRR